MNQLPSGTVTFLFTDIESSTRLAREYPDTWESARARHHAILHSAIEASHGHVFQIIGDSFSAAFRTAGDALRAAVKAQFDLYHEEWRDAVIKVRMGIHTGRAEIQENGEYHGYAALSRVHARRGEMAQAAALREEARLLMIGVDGTEERFGRDSYY